MANIYIDKTEILTLKNLIQALFSDEMVNNIDDSFDMDNARPGIYRSWGKKPINAPSDCVAWAKYFTIPFIEGNSNAMIQLVIDTDGNLFTRSKGGSPVRWGQWHIVPFGGVINHLYTYLRNTLATSINALHPLTRKRGGVNE